MFIFIFLWAIAANWIAYRKGFYRLPLENKKAVLSLSHLQLFACFAIYLILALFLAPLIARYLLKILYGTTDLTTIPIIVLTGLQLAIMVAIFSLLQIFMFSSDPILVRKIWKNSALEYSRPIEFDFGLGILTWILSFPIVTIMSEVIDFLLKLLFGYTYLEQTAVKFVKQAVGSPLSLIFALLSVLVMAPLIEEFLFRGVLQTYLKKRLGPRIAILLSALFFAFFHFSLSQGLGNISLLLSLFLLGGYLGFLYQRQGSLWAPIGLHMSFNLVSALRILFFPETAT